MAQVTAKLVRDNFGRFCCSAAALLLCLGVWAEPQEWRINIQDGGLLEFVQQVAEITGKDIVVDPRVRQANNVTVVSNTPLDQEGVFALFLTVLRTHGYSLSRAGDVYTVVQNTVGKQTGGRIDSEGAVPDEIVTEVVAVNHILATDVVKTLRPLIPQYAHIAAVESANVVIISDHAHNIRRLMTIIEQTDLPGTEIIVVVALQHAWAGTVARLLQELAPGSLGVSAQGPTSVQIVANEGNNTLVLRGKEEPLRRVESIVRQLDQPDTASGATQVIRLDHADATEVAEMLNAMASSTPGTGDQPPPSVHAYESLNAVVARGDPSFVNDLRGIISQLDSPRGQVLIEVAVVEVSADANDSLGIEVAAGDPTGVSTPLFTTTLNGIIGGLLTRLASSDEAINPAIAAAAVGSPTLALTRLDPDAVSFGAIVNALAVDANADLLSTPSVLTLDNEEAQITVGQEVPIVTGAFTTTSDGASNPFTTVSRKDVGIDLSVTPHIHGESLRLELVQEVSNVVDTALEGFTDIVTNKRKLTNTILVDDRQTIVLGGLIQDDQRSTLRKVPLLGDIPVAGALFRSSTSVRVKRHLLFFLRPTIQRTPDDLRATTDEKYDGILDLRLDAGEASSNAGDLFQGR